MDNFDRRYHEQKKFDRLRQQKADKRKTMRVQAPNAGPYAWGRQAYKEPYKEWRVPLYGVRKGGMMARGDIIYKEYKQMLQQEFRRERDAQGRFVPVRQPVMGDVRWIAEGENRKLARYDLERDAWVDQNGEVVAEDVMQAAAAAAKYNLNPAQVRLNELIAEKVAAIPVVKHPAPNEWGALDEKRDAKFVPAWRPMLSFARGISCGVGTLQGFYHGHTPENYLKDVISYFKRHWVNNKKTLYSRVGNFLPCGTVFWTDRAAGAGTKFGDWLIEQFPECPPVRSAAINYQSGKEIVSFMWSPDPDVLTARPEWAEVLISAEPLKW